MGISLGASQYRKAENRVVRIYRDTDRHELVDLERFGPENHGEVFIAADRPRGVIGASVVRGEAPDPGDAWLAVPAFA